MRTARSDLDSVAARFQAWRASRPRRRALPDRLWRAAVGLLDRHSSSAICRRLRLNQSRFKRAREVFAAAGATTRTTDNGGWRSRTYRRVIPRARRAFVELPPLALQPGRQLEAHGMPGECRLVLEGGTGARLSVEFARVEPSWLRSVCTLLLGAGPAWARPSERT